MRRRLRTLALVIVALAVAPAAAAAPAVDGVFDMPGVTTNGQLTVGPDGNIWVALDAGVARVKPDGTVKIFASADLNNTLGAPSGGITSAGGFVWVSQAPSGGKKPLVKIPPADPATATGVDMADLTAGATAMTTGPDGNVWVGIADKIVRFSPANPATFTTFPFPGVSPKGMTWASDGTLWVTDPVNGRLLNVTTGGASTPYPVGGNPQFVGAGPNAQIAFGNPNSTPQQIGLLSPGGTPQLLDRPNGSDPFGVTFGADGAYWIAEFAGNRLARVTTDGQLTTLGGFPVAPNQGPRQITVGPNNTLWTTIDTPSDTTKSKIARISGVEPPPVTTPGDQTPTGGDQTPTGGQTPTTTTPPDTTAPVIAGAKLSKTKIRARTRSIKLRVTLSEPATLKLVLSRRGTVKRRTLFIRVRSTSAKGLAGPNSIRISTRKLRPGRYRVVLTGADAAGNKAAPVTRSFRIL